MSLYSIYRITEPFSCPLLIVSKGAQVTQCCQVRRRRRWAGHMETWNSNKLDVFIDQPADVTVWSVILPVC